MEEDDYLTKLENQNYELKRLNISLNQEIQAQRIASLRQIRLKEIQILRLTRTVNQKEFNTNFQKSFKQVESVMVQCNSFKIQMRNALMQFLDQIRKEKLTKSMKGSLRNLLSHVLQDQQIVQSEANSLSVNDTESKDSFESAQNVSKGKKSSLL